MSAGATKDGSLRTVSLDAVAMDAFFQIREKLNPRTVESYQHLYRAGTEMPPVEVALVDGIMILVDGWHRATALKALGREMIEATVTKMTRQEARWKAADANSRHGLQLKPAEKRQRFRVYVETGQQQARQRGKVKSYREMERDLGMPFTTIRSWMQKDFPKVAAQIGGGQPEKVEKPQEPERTPAVERSVAAIADLAAAFQSTSVPADRGEIIALIEDALQRLKGSGNWASRAVDEFADDDEGL
ncbi:hypothetical protein [Methylobacterium aerolatum]|uniref:Uridine kinase n=1 Tax=Methylobacterium aerolatum TaxID=418708 RepID=A0ABU0HZS2_9HYPH|nr:hypothetical protein [Methylobacterium aerolatum]MDQ0447283.1 uridine kinase [Methylobacterium aerolatum]GJD36949.1 hypothetical protein FMGBMHLM_3874 [Methylobacterium aerolatum]